MREAFARATSAIQAWPDAQEAKQATDDLQALIKDLQREAAEFRGHLAAYLMGAHGLSRDELAAFLGVSGPRVSQIIAAARKRGNPVTEPLTLPEQAHVALAVITSDRGVLIAKRKDGVPPWTFLGGEIEPGETAGDALRRRVQAEAGLTVTSMRFIGRRLHPRTSRLMVYGHVQVGTRRTAARRPRGPSGGPLGQHRRDADPYGRYVFPCASVSGRFSENRLST